MMKCPMSVWLCLGVLAFAGGAGPDQARAAAKPTAKAPAAAPAPNAGAARPQSWLPDSTVLARVGSRVIRAGEFSDSYFASDPEYRPKPDSAGRVEFLHSMINKDVLAQVALKANRPLDFEDRATMREHTARVLSNVLFERMVIDSIPITEADIQRVYGQFGYEWHLKHIVLIDRESAERARRELKAHPLPWPVAVRKYSIAPDKVNDGELGWRSRLGMDANLAYAVCGLEPGSISDVYEDPDGFHLVMLVEKRSVKSPALEPLRTMIVDQIRTPLVGKRSRAIQVPMLAGLNVTYDDAAIAWAAAHFKQTVTTSAGSINIDPNLPDFAPTDTAKVLARYRDGSVTLGRLLRTYSDLQPIMRPTMSTPAALKEQVDAIIVEPRLVALAYERGLDKDPTAVALIEKRREQILVEHLYSDSIQAKVRVTEAMRRDYYERNKPGFVTYPKVRFASFVAHSKAGADSLTARLAKGEKAETILFADSIAGIQRGAIQERQQNEHGPYQKILFEELRPGQTTTVGPDAHGDFLVLQLLNFDPGHQLQYSEVANIVDESVQNEAADKMLRAFIDRHKKAYTIEAHPERVMRIRLAAT